MRGEDGYMNGRGLDKRKWVSDNGCIWKKLWYYKVVLYNDID